MKKNKFFAGVIVLLFALSFGVSQAGIRPPSTELEYEITFGPICMQYISFCAIPPDNLVPYWEWLFPFRIL